MLSKFILVSETRFQNTGTALKNQQASNQGLETQISQLSKLISERPQGSLPSNTEPNPREQLNAINIQDAEGVVEAELESRQETVKSKDPHIVTTTPNEEIPLTVLSIFPFGTVEVSHPKFGTFKRHGQVHGGAYGHVKIGQGFPQTWATIKRNGCALWPRYHVVFTRKENRRTCLEEEEESVIFPGSNRRNSSPSPTVPPRALGRAFPNTSEQVQMADAIRALLTIDPWELFFGIIEPTYLELTMELCSTFNLQTVMTNYDDPGMVQFHLDGLVCQLSVPEFAHKITERRESIGVINTHDAYFLRCMSHGHIINIAYFIALAIQHRTERHRKGVISIGPYVMRLARHFGLLDTAAQESSLTLIGQMSPQGISSILSMRMIERRRGTYPPQYRHVQSTEEEAYEDIPNDVPSQHEDPPTQPPPPSRPVHAAVSYTDIFELLTGFEQQFFSTSTSHRQSHLANHPAMKIYIRVLKLIIASELKTPPGKVLHDCHVLIDHDHSYH
ncbi:hypothetical protein GOBAR_AA26511 [Gossypium barbadense]|uniref:Uncharacterized protein n=1 Tax=Gossypium barbadense TaxID=3634 RepID=A0A2P5WSU4_GOSBA|nr:hypothetical protein GOBAR_AA26511 [Gossypium barbadense]